MRAHLRNLSVALAVLSGVAAVPVSALEQGRVFDPRQRFRLSATVGEVSTLDGFVQETTRRLLEVTGQPQVDNAEAFSFDELGIDSSETTFGLSLEYLWRWMTLEFQGSVMRAEARGVASRDFFIGVNDIRFQDQVYEHQVILEGSEYRADVEAALMGLRASVTPVTFNARGAVQFMPWIHVGLFGFTGQFEVDAGPPVGVQQYERPVRDYVENGRGSGDVTAFVPELGAGGELKFRLGERNGRQSNLVVEAGYSLFDFRGSTSDLGISARNDKDLGVDYESLNAGLYLEWPWTSGADFVLGAEFRELTADAESKAKDRSLAETLQLREKFDKDIRLEVTTVNLLFGARW